MLGGKSTSSVHPSQESADCQGALPHSISEEGFVIIKCSVLCTSERTVFGEIIDRSQPTCFSLAEGNTTGSIFWSEHVAALNLMALPADQTFLAVRRQVLFLQGGTGCFKPPHCWDSTACWPTHAQSICVHKALTSVPAWVRKTPLPNTFHPVQQSWSESLNKGNCNRHLIFR